MQRPVFAYLYGSIKLARYPKEFYFGPFKLSVFNSFFRLPSWARTVVAMPCLPQFLLLSDSTENSKPTRACSFFITKYVCTFFKTVAAILCAQHKVWPVACFILPRFLDVIVPPKPTCC